MGCYIVEVVAGNELACQLVTAVAQASPFDTHLGAVEVDLPPYEAEGGPIGDAGVVVEVEPLMQSVLADGR